MRPNAEHGLRSPFKIAMCLLVRGFANGESSGRRDGTTLIQLERVSVLAVRKLEGEATHSAAIPFVASGKLNRSSVLDRLNGRSVLILGSSVDEFAVHDLCEAADLETDKDFFGAVRHDITDVACKVDNFVVMKYPIRGCSVPPYWNGYTAGPMTQSPRSEDVIKKNAVEYAKEKLGGGAPSVVALNTMLWDLAGWWKARGMPETAEVPSERIDKWCHTEVLRALGWVKDAFPESKVVFVIAPTISEVQYGRSPNAVDDLTDCVRKSLAEHNESVVDFHGIVDKLLDVPSLLKLVSTERAADTSNPSDDVFRDYVHLAAGPNLEYMNKLMNMAAY